MEEGPETDSPRSSTLSISPPDQHCGLAEAYQNSRDRIQRVTLEFELEPSPNPKVNKRNTNPMRAEIGYASRHMMPDGKMLIDYANPKSITETLIKAIGSVDFPDDFAINILLKPGTYEKQETIECLLAATGIKTDVFPIQASLLGIKFELYIENNYIMFKSIVEEDFEFESEYVTKGGFQSPRFCLPFKAKKKRSPGI